jgi:hypothetical protein
LGHLELNLPEPEVRFARNWLAWVAGNADVLRRARVCLEDEAACVVSKVRDGQGAVFVVNYQPGKRTFRMKLTTGARTPLTIRPVYPVRQVPFQVRDGEEVEVEVRGESVAVLDVNQGLNSLPPQNPGVLRLDVADWQREEGGWVAHFTLPDPSASLRTGLAAARDPHLPRELVSLEQLEETDPVRKAADSTGAVGWLGRGPLPALFLQAYGFRDGQTVETWKIAPWAFADRVWLVYRPPRPPRLSDQWPEARVNGKTVPLVPRVDYRPAKPEDWTCSLFFADLTEVCQSCPERSRRNGRRNLVWLAEPDGSRPGACYVMAADRRQ